MQENEHLPIDTVAPNSTYLWSVGTCRILGDIRIVINLTLILTLKPDPYSNPNHNPNTTYPN